jgi:hypothetical protein
MQISMASVSIWVIFKIATLRPLDELFIDHFMQGLLKHMKGAGKPAQMYEGYDNAFGDGCNLSNERIWGTREGKGRFDLGRI